MMYLSSMSRLLKSILVTQNRAKNLSFSSQKNFKVAIAGSSGGIGQSLCLLLKLNPLVTRLACYDVSPVTPGVAVDLSHIDTPVKVTGHRGPDNLAGALKDADLVIIPAGTARKIDQTRDDLFGVNASIICDIGRSIVKNCPRAVCCIITNPVNSMVPLLSEIMKKANAYDPRCILGVTTLDLIRASTFVAEINRIDPVKVWVPCIGGHSLYTIVPLLSQSKPPLKLTDKEKIKKLSVRIQAAGHEVAVAKANRGTATLSMAFAAARMGSSVLRGLSGEPNVIECSYVKSDLTECPYFSSPVLLGKCGVEKVLNYGTPNALEQEQLKVAIPALLKNIKTGVDFANKDALPPMARA